MSLTQVKASVPGSWQLATAMFLRLILNFSMLNELCTRCVVCCDTRLGESVIAGNQVRSLFQIYQGTKPVTMRVCVVDGRGTVARGGSWCSRRLTFPRDGPSPDQPADRSVVAGTLSRRDRRHYGR